MRPLSFLFAQARPTTEVADAAHGAPGSVPDVEFAAHHEAIFGLDSYAIVAIAFVLFVLILWKAGAFRILVQALDQQAEKVRAELAEAASIRADAEQIRAAAAAEAKAATEQAAAVLRNAEEEARKIVTQALADAEAQIGRRTSLAEERIGAEVRAAEAALRQRTAGEAVAAARMLIGHHAGELGPLADSAISSISSLTHD